MSKSVYIVLTHTGSFLSQAIKGVTKSSYTHASLSLDKSLENIYSFGRRKPYNPFIGGFVREDFINGTYSWFPDSTTAIYQLDIPEEKYKQLVKIIQFFDRYSDQYNYNVLGLVGVPLNRDFSLPFTYFCSQFVAEVLSLAGIQLFSKKISMVSPNDFHNHQDLKLIYEGELYKYPYLYSTPHYQPKAYQHFPFRKYVKQQLFKYITKTPANEAERYYFVNGFIRPKKIYIGDKFKRIAKARALLNRFIG